jgi:hypothetical protein
MKLQTSIPARRDGTLTVQGLDGKAYKFATDADGVLTGEVEDEATVAHLLGTGNFYPENPEDFDAALRLAAEGDGDDTGEGEGEGEGHDANQAADDADDEQDDEAADEAAVGAALPVEANSPLKPLPDVKAGGKPKSKK